MDLTLRDFKNQKPVIIKETDECEGVIQVYGRQQCRNSTWRHARMRDAQRPGVGTGRWWRGALVTAVRQHGQSTISAGYA